MLLPWMGWVVLIQMERPPQLDYVQNWDAAIDITLRRLVYGSLSGATSGLLLFRNPTTRWAAVAFGAGAGVGSAFTGSSELFRGLFGVSFSAPKHVDSAKPEPVEAQAWVELRIDRWIAISYLVTAEKQALHAERLRPCEQ